MTVEDLVKSGRLGDVFVLARYLYRVGDPILSDSVYDNLEAKLKEAAYLQYKDYFHRSYDDDPIPMELLRELNITPTSNQVSAELYQYLDDEKSYSIRAVRSYEDAFEFMRNNPGKDFIASLKMDGVNGKSLYRDEQYLLSISRGRKGNSLEYTKGAKFVMPKQLDTSGLVRVTGEFFVDSDYLPVLREKYHKSYKTCKSSALSILQVEHSPEDYEHLRFVAFDTDLPFSKVSDKYQFLSQNGFEVPPFLKVSNPPTDFEKFKLWLDTCVLDAIHTECKEMPSDGVVLEVDDLTDCYNESFQYNDRQIALKFSHWDFGYEKGIITDIKIEQRRVFKSVRIEIQPIITKDGCRAEFINSYDPSILIKNDLYVGKTVYFEKNSNAVNILIYGDRLKEIKQREEVYDAYC